jgi:hypothetical protein
MASEIKVDTVSEKTSGSGVTIDGLLIKDGGISGDVSLIGTTPTFTIGDAGAEDAALVFDGNAQDFYIALDDSADDLVIGKGSTVGTTPAVSIDENLQVIVHDNLSLLSDSSVLKFGADGDTTLTHTDGTGLTLNSANKLTFRDTGLYVGSNADGDLDIVSDGTAIDSVNIESAGGITLDAGSTTHGITYEDDGTAMLQITNSSSDVIIKPLVDAKDIIFQQYDGTAVLTIEDNATANIPAGKLAIGGTAVTSTASELNLLDGGTSVGSSITLADADGFVVNDGGTMKTIPASDINTYASGNLVKISSGTWNASTDTLSLSNVFTTTYKHFVFYLTNVIPSGNAGVGMHLETGGSGSYVTSSSYHYVLTGRDTSGNLTNTQDNNASKIEFQAQSILGGHGSKRGNYIIDFFNPMDGNCYTTMNTQSTYHDADGATEFNKGAAAYLANTAVTGFRVLLSSGNIDTYAANYALYGLKA